MLLSVKQYAFFIALFVAILVSVFSYKIITKLESSRLQIEASQKSLSINELEHAISITLKNIRQSTDMLSHWQEVRQQINNPEIFAYWYNVRFKNFAFDLQRFTQELMVYDISGNALAELDDNTLPLKIKVNDINDFSFRVINDSDIIYITPVYGGDLNAEIIGYLSTRMQLLPLLKSLSSFQNIELNTLHLKADDTIHTMDTLKADGFTYRLHKDVGILVLEKQMRDSVFELLLIIVIPIIILFLTLIFVFGLPIKEVDDYINRLRTQKGVANDDGYHNFFQVRELQSVYDSLDKYHTELSQKEEHISLTLNSIGDAVITTDSHNRIVRMNPVAEQLTGWTFEKAEGKSVKQVFILLDAITRKRIEGPFDKVINTGNIVHISEESVLISKSGKEYYISDSAAPIRDSSGEIRGIVLVFNDITERKLKDEQLQQSQKMDALGKLTGGIAHDFNNLLGVILGYSELLKTLLGDQSKAQRYAEQIHVAGERARKLTAKLLAFARKETPEAMVTDVNQLILSEQHMLEKTLTARVELILKLAEGAWPVFIDQSQLRDAILNISINAMHAMPDGGRLTLTTQMANVDVYGQHHIDLEVGDYLQLTISDNGEGMDQATCRRIFDPFFTTKGDKGTGLGMSQVYGFVQQSGGAIHVFSEPGVGTTITIYLPRFNDVDNVLEDSQESAQDILSEATGSETILLVDDEEALLDLSGQILSNNGYTVIKANSGSEALDILESKRVDLLFTDVIMPKMDGYQLAKIVSEKYPEIKIQIVSGYSDDRNLDAGYDQLHEPLLNKPYSSEELLKRVREALDS